VAESKPECLECHSLWTLIYGNAHEGDWDEWYCAKCGHQFIVKRPPARWPLSHPKPLPWDKK